MLNSKSKDEDSDSSDYTPIELGTSEHYDMPFFEQLYDGTILTENKEMKELRALEN